MFAILATIILCVVAGISLVLLLRPSLYMRRFPNPWMKDTPWTRLQMRVVGLIVCLFLLLMLSGILGGVSRSRLLDGFSDNILVALWVAFTVAWVGGILSWVLWRFPAFRSFIGQRFSIDKIKSAKWEHTVTISFCALLFAIVAAAVFLAAAGYHPNVRGK
jgi:CBS domain containing-hemolysin-like protein